MSDDWGGDIDDELLELAGATEKKRKRSQANTSSKRRKADPDAEGESEEDSVESEEETSETSNPYPLEGKFVDEADRARLMEFPEIVRENILAQRQEEMQRFTDKRQLEMMLKLQSGHAQGDDSVSKAAKRQHAIRGATKEKSKKLDELKAKRKLKDERKRTRTNSPKRDRSSSPMDMETSDEEEEDGQFTKFDEEEERDRKLFSKIAPEEDQPMTIDDLNKCRLTRDLIAKHCMTPWFDEYVKGAWVRFLIPGADAGVYRICEVQELSPNIVKPYRVNDQLVNQEFELKHGQSTRRFPMDKVSNSPFSQSEFDRLIRVCEAEKVTLPTKRQAEKKAAQMQKLASQPMTESDIAAMLARKQAIDAARNGPQSSALERSRLQQVRTLASRRQDHAEVAAIDAKLAELAANTPSRAEPSADILASINERNRKRNMEQVRRAEREALERKRRQRTGTSTPTRSTAPQDAAGKFRAKVLGLDGSRPGTPGTPGAGNTSASVSPSSTPARDTPSKTNGTLSFEASILQSVEIDLGDF